jgi:hypothetical protein
MKSKTMSQVHQEMRTYETYYKPSFNLLHTAKCILGVFIYGRSTVAPNYASLKRRLNK